MLLLYVLDKSFVIRNTFRSKPSRLVVEAHAFSPRWKGDTPDTMVLHINTHSQTRHHGIQAIARLSLVTAGSRELGLTRMALDFCNDALSGTASVCLSERSLFVSAHVLYRLNVLAFRYSCVPLLHQSRFGAPLLVRLIYLTDGVEIKSGGTQHCLPIHHCANKSLVYPINKTSIGSCPQMLLKECTVESDMCKLILISFPV